MPGQDWCAGCQHGVGDNQHQPAVLVQGFLEASEKKRFQPLGLGLRFQTVVVGWIEVEQAKGAGRDPHLHQGVAPEQMIDSLPCLGGPIMIEFNAIGDGA